MGRKEPDYFAGLAHCDPYWLDQIGIVCDDDRYLESILDSVPHEMTPEIDVAAFLFSLLHEDQFW